MNNHQPDSNAYDYIFKLVLIGDSGVGKSSILSRFTDDSFQDMCDGTIGVDFKTRSMGFGGKKIRLQIWDTAGSFENVKSWLKEVDAHACEGVVKAIVGNKADLMDKTMVAFREAKDFAARQEIPFFQTSAKCATKIDNVFITISRLIMEKVDPPPPQTPPQAGTIFSAWSSRVLEGFKDRKETASSPDSQPPTTSVLDGADRSPASIEPSGGGVSTSIRTPNLEKDNKRLTDTIRIVRALLEDTNPHLSPGSTVPPLVTQFIERAKRCTVLVVEKIVYKPSDAFSGELEMARLQVMKLVGKSVVGLLERQVDYGNSHEGIKPSPALVRVVTQCLLINACLEEIVAETVSEPMKYPILQKFSTVLKLASWGLPDVASRNDFESALEVLISTVASLRLARIQEPESAAVCMLSKPNFALMSALRVALVE